jgi:centromere protein C
MDQDDDDEDTDTVQDMEETPVRPSKTKKGKERAQDLEQDQQEDHEVEREIAQGLEDVELSHHSDTELNVPPPNKKAKVAHEKPKRTRTRKIQPPERSRTAAIFFFVIW